VQFRILGPLEVVDHERPIEIAGAKQRAILALLLLHANEVVRTDRLIDDVWGENAPRNAAGALHNQVSRLRKTLGHDVLASREWGYVLRTEPGAIDLDRFEELVAVADPLPAHERSKKLAEALALWRGPALADLAGEPALRTEIARLDELRLATLERRIEADLEVGKSTELVGELETLIAAEPLRESLRGQLILALYRAGRQAEALEVFRETRRVLTEELGLEPSPALRDLEKAILRQDPAIAAAPPERPAVAAPVGRSPRFGLLSLLLLMLALAVLAGGVGAGVLLVFGKSHDDEVAAAQAPQATEPTAPAGSFDGGAQLAAPSTTRADHHLSAHRSSVRTTTRASTKRAAERTTDATAPPVKARVSRVVQPPPPPPPPGPPPAPPKPTHPRVVTISDKFADDLIDGRIWYRIYQGTGWTVSQTGGRLRWEFPPGTAPGGTWNNYGGHLGTRCLFPGDFDARVEYTLVDWPTANGVFVSLWTFFKPDNEGWESWRASSTEYGEQYGSFLGPQGGSSVELADNTGTLRLRRKAGVVTAYFLHKGRWVVTGSSTNWRRTVIAIGAGSGPGIAPVRSDRVVVELDNFTVTAVDPDC
jgi:DNA-binding SARP family transcriptional activator